MERRRRAAEQRASFRSTTVDVPTATAAPATESTVPESAITVTTVAAPKATEKAGAVVEPDEDEPADLVETETPASADVPPVTPTTTRTQSSKQTRTRRKR